MTDFISDKLFGLVMSITKKRKEKIDLIVEPLQGVITLSLLSFLPEGTKISIQNNHVVIQEKSLYQGLTRWYNNDNKNDLQHLVLIIKRFLNIYEEKNKKLFNLLKKLLLKSIDKLLITYQEDGNVIQTLQICKVLLLDSNSEIKNLFEKKEIDNILIKISEIYEDNFLNLLYYLLLNMEDNPQNINENLTSLIYLYNPYIKKIKLWISRNFSN